MRTYRLVLVLLCLGLLGALPFVLSLPKPDTAGEAAVQGQTAVQRQMGLQQQTAIQPGGPMRAEIGMRLTQAKNLAAAGEYQKALAVVDGLERVPIPNKTALEAKYITETRQYVLVKIEGARGSQTR